MRQCYDERRAEDVTVSENELLAGRFEESRAHLRAVAYRMLGSLSEADDAVQEAWLRLGRSDARQVDNLGGWLTTVVARICLDMLRARKARREEPMIAHVPDPIVARDDPAETTLLADSIGLALLVVLETLAPPERLAFVLHDLFGMSFEEIAPIVERTPAAARQLASRARRRVQTAPHAPERDLARQRQVVDAFLAASRGGDLAGLLAVLAPDVVLRAERGGVVNEIRGAENVAKGSLLYSKTAPQNRVEHRALVNGSAGLVAFAGGQPFSVLGFTIVGDQIVEVDVLADPERLARLDLSEFA
jgi:RNA polymerase sigma-70 factor (ECF subfamily)